MSNDAGTPTRLLTGEGMEQLAQIIGDSFSGTEITRLFHRAGHSQISHDGGTKWRFVASAFEMLQARDRSPNGVLAVVQRAASPEGWLRKDRSNFETFLAEANSVLEFYSLRVTEEGKLVRIGRAATTITRTKSPDQLAFDARQLHPFVIKHARSHFYRGAYFHAVFESCKAFDSTMRQATGSDKSGQALMSDALSPQGSVKLNRQLTTSERDEQQGVMFLCMGLMNAVRNPQAHEPELHWPMTLEDALDVLGLISFLFREIENAMVVRPDSTTRVELR